MAKVNGGIIKAATENKVAPAQQTMTALVKSMEGQIAKALPSVLTPERFTRMVLTALSTTPALQRCEPKSFLGAMMQAAQLGVEPNTPLGQAYIIPYGNQAQFQLGVKGLCELAYRSGEITDIQTHEVMSNDTFEYELGLTPKLKHIPALKDRGEVILYYAVFHTKSGGYGFEVMSVEDIKRHRDKFSKAAKGGFSPWTSNFDEMAKKTVVKKVLKYAPIKTEFMRGMAADETVKSTISEDMVDLQDETVIDVTPENVNKTTGEIEEEIPFEGSLES